MTDIPSDGLVRGRTTRRELLGARRRRRWRPSRSSAWPPAVDSSGGTQATSSCTITPDYEESIIKPMVKSAVQRPGTRGRAEVSHDPRDVPADTRTSLPDRLRTQFQAGNADVDVIPGDVIWPPQFASNGWISDLSERLPSEKPTGTSTSPVRSPGNTYEGEGKLYGIPWFTDSGLLYYRSDLLEKSGFQRAAGDLGRASRSGREGAGGTPR